MALSANTTLTFIRGEDSQAPVKGSTTIYEGAMLGDSSGYARGLVSGDPFIGHSKEYIDNSSGSDGDLKVKRMRGRYRLQVTLSSVAVTDVGKDVYATADDTLTLTAGGTRVGKVDRYVTTDTAIVEFQTTDRGAIDLGNNVVVITNAGAPTDGTSGTGAGLAGPGSVCVDYTNAKAYINTNTKASPTWTVLGTQTT